MHPIQHDTEVVTANACLKQPIYQLSAARVAFSPRCPNGPETCYTSEYLHPPSISIRQHQSSTLIIIIIIITIIIIIIITITIIIIIIIITFAAHHCLSSSVITNHRQSSSVIIGQHQSSIITVSLCTYTQNRGFGHGNPLRGGGPRARRTMMRRRKTEPSYAVEGALFKAVSLNTLFEQD